MKVFENVVAQFIGRLCLINQATTRGSLVHDMRVFENVARGFSLVHDPEGSHYDWLRTCATP